MFKRMELRLMQSKAFLRFSLGKMGPICGVVVRARTHLSVLTKQCALTVKEEVGCGREDHKNIYDPTIST